ncbi:hypothetical protein UFOVP459_42 [uncultured Caudovirales phage]|uniref:Uncharacterized protein n=1 Tax=uncultured Caudovirales phage TaxID=2100421 RepID=A0A6J5SHB7_9CAUD|nr:hypothetical protein UFOVP459_42 [uncultured Caudovirales phage]CAB4183193.1 hypothetical protein UFOVP1089_43 [uncultured Caudovirales phage]CAB4213055.1 hypothetical protein UFOVP1443_62 [uncultured Caudovirales phage]
MMDIEEFNESDSSSIFVVFKLKENKKFSMQKSFETKKEAIEYIECETALRLMRCSEIEDIYLIKEYENTKIIYVATNQKPDETTSKD